LTAANIMIIFEDMKAFNSLLFSLLLIVGCSVKTEPSVTGEFLYESAEFPQCHAATIVEYPQGELVAAFFGGSWESADDVCIYLCRKKIGEKQWSAPVKIAEDSLHACWNPVLYAPGDGRLMLFYKTGRMVAEWKGHVKTSYDGGLTWPETYDFPDGMLGAIKNKPVALPSGRIVSPSSDETDGWKIHFELSDDGGRSWCKVGPVAADDSVGVIQPSIIVHKDGSLQALCRTWNARIASTVSNDGGETWSKVELLDYPNNNSGVDAMTLPDGRFVMLCNPVGIDRGPRYPLVASISSDGRNWTELLTLESEPVENGYCYPSAILGSDGAIHVVFTWDRKKIKYARIEL